MDDAAQAQAYAAADFSAPHQRFIDLFRQSFPDASPATALDLGCGAGDITLRFAVAYPACHVHGIDGAAAMVRCGEEAFAHAGVGTRVTLQVGYLPSAAPPLPRYDAVISNSLLHHLIDPQVLWQTVRRHAAPGAPVFVMDLQRPTSRDEARALVETYSGEEPEILRRDFFNSLLAAYRADEVEEQLAQAGLDHLTVETISDRHLLVRGTL